jgi:hypothetical protein
LVLEPAPLVARSRKRTVAKGDSMTLVVRKCFQCSAGKSNKVTRRSQLATSDSTALDTWPDTPLGNATLQPRSRRATQRTSSRAGRAWQEAEGVGAACRARCPACDTSRPARGSRATELSGISPANIANRFLRFLRIPLHL